MNNVEKDFDIVSRRVLPNPHPNNTDSDFTHR